MHKEIYYYFKKFGEIDSIIYRRQNPECIFVEFKSAASAIAAAIENKHQIEDKELDIKIVFNRQNDINETEEVRSTLANMNIDANDEVRVKRDSLSRSDLCSIAEVCTHFKSNTENVFSERFSHLYTAAGREDSDELKRLFKNFGSLIRSVEVENRFLFSITVDKDKTLFQLLVTYSSSLESLTLRNVFIEPDFIPQLKPIFERLKYLAIEINPIQALGSRDIGLSLDCCPELEELHLETIVDLLKNS